MSISLLAEVVQSGCTLNNQPIDCAELADKAQPFIGLGIGIFTIIMIVALVSFVFWLLMLIHAIKHKSPNRDTWIIILVASFVLGLGFIGALVYLIVEKKKAELATPSTVQQAEVLPQKSEPTKK